MSTTTTTEIPAHAEQPLLGPVLPRSLRFPVRQASSPSHGPALPPLGRHDESCAVVKQLHPKDIKVSSFAQRHPLSYKDAEFMDLRADIKAAGGNVQPILVRPFPGVPGRYELCFGSRRRQACLEENLPVLALIETMSDLVFFERTERENRLHKNLSPFERGMMYRNALAANIYPNQAQLAKALQIDATSLGRVLAIANLEQALLDAFASPHVIQYSWGPRLQEAYATNREAVLSEAARLAAPGLDGERSPKSVFERLVAAAADKSVQVAAKSETDVTIAGTSKQSARIRRGTKGCFTVKFFNIAQSRADEIEAMVRQFVGYESDAGFSGRRSSVTR